VISVETKRQNLVEAIKRGEQGWLPQGGVPNGVTSRPRALVVGCHGQDGVYLSQFLNEKGYEVTGIARGSSPDICDPMAVRELVRSTLPQEIYHLAAYHHSAENRGRRDRELVRRSLLVNTLSLDNFLEAVATEAPVCRVFYAASSRVFGRPQSAPQDESTPMDPHCAYGISKAAGIRLCRYYREKHGVYCSAGILYNHESPLRAADFLSRKVVRAALRVQQGRQEKVVLGSLEPRVDWGYAPDYVAAMWHTLQLSEAQDFVIATGELHSVRDLAETAFGAVGLRWQDHVVVDPSLLTEPPGDAVICGNASKLRKLSGWSPQTTFQEMIVAMVTAERERHEP